jgi:hypothetical protein
VGAFATDQTLNEADLELLTIAQRGDKAALRRVCDRFKTPLLAMLLYETCDWESASHQVETLLERLCRELLAGELMTADWARRCLAVAEQQPAIENPAENGSGLEGLGSIARVVKRRALRSLLPTLPLPELTALLLVYLDSRRPCDLAGLVADTPEVAAACVVKAHETVQAALKHMLHAAGATP